MSTERLIVSNEHSDDYHQRQQHHTMQQHYPTVTVLPGSNSSKPKQCAAEHEQVFDELPKATIVAVSRPDSSDISPMLLSYTIELQYKQFKWSLVKKASQILYLHFAVKKRAIINELHEKQEQVKEWLQSIGIVDQVAVVQDDDEPDDGAVPMHSSESVRNRYVPSMAALSILRPALGKQTVADRAKLAMQGYLNHFVGNIDIVNSREVCKFLEVSRLSFSEEYGPKLKEGYVMVKHLSNISKTDDAMHCTGCCFSCCNNNWQKVSCGSQSIKLRTTSSGNVKEWVAAINDAGLRPLEGWCHPHRFGSYAPPRGLTEDGSQAQWFIDGQAAFKAIASAIENAKSQILITGWWLCPELYLRRPFENHPSSRLDALLEEKAKEGIQIYILLYKEVSVALKINSMYSKKRLLKIHENVKVLRHPDHFSTGVYLWSHHEKLVIVDYHICFIGGLDLCFGRYDTIEHKVGDCPPSLWPGKDYYNPRESEPNSWEDTMKDELERQKYPRMPWHDVHCALWGPPCRDIARHFVQRWNHAKIIRSVSQWSAGTSQTEDSIHSAYCSLIESAEHFIYIENQFFISGLSGDETIQNRILEALFRRIVRAYKEQKYFRVIVVLPLIPGFQGGIDDGGAATVRAIIHWQYRTISREKTSILHKLSVLLGPKAQDYISFYGLRSYGRLCDGGPVATSQVYVHSKVMIIDDRAALIGSSNINDRSLLGSRDSEIDVVIEDKEFLESSMNGEPWKAGKFSHSLRCSLWAEHLGLHAGEISRISDPLADTTYRDLWQATAKENTLIYEDVFDCIPNEVINSRSALRHSMNRRKEKLGHTTIDFGIAPEKLETNKNGEIIATVPMERLKSVKGHLVTFPLQFMCQEDLRPVLIESEFYASPQVFH